MSREEDREAKRRKFKRGVRIVDHRVPGGLAYGLSDEELLTHLAISLRTAEGLLEMESVKAATVLHPEAGKGILELLRRIERLVGKV